MRGTYTGQLMDKEGSHLPPLLSLPGMQQQRLILDLQWKVAIIPGTDPVVIEVGKSGKVVKLLESESGHLLLPLDEKFVKASSQLKKGELIFATEHSKYYFESDDYTVDSSGMSPEHGVGSEAVQPDE